MPSLILGNPVASGAHVVISGNPWSGHIVPQGGIQLRWLSSGGNCYISLSGGALPVLSGAFMTINSGGFILSGGANSGLLDGMALAPGDAYFIPAAGIQSRGGASSGIFNVFAICDGAASGVGRLYFDVW